MKEFDQLNKTIKKLRSPGGCPWDRVQTIDTMKQYLLEEAYELSDAVNAKSLDGVREELGDIFLILIVLSHMHCEKQSFSLEDVLECVNEKLITRHPHVFSTKKLRTKKEVLDHWVKSKAIKKKRKTIKCRLPVSAPSLMLAALFNKEMSHLVSKVNNTDSFADIIDGIKNGLNKLEKKQSPEASFSSILFDLGRLAFAFGVDLEGALREKVLKEAEGVSYGGSEK